MLPQQVYAHVFAERYRNMQQSRLYNGKIIKSFCLVFLSSRSVGRNAYDYPRQVSS